VGWTTFSDGRYKKNVEEDVPGLDFISKLRPVTYTTDITGLDNHYPKPTPREGQELPTLGDVSKQEKIRYSGFIAQEVEAAAKEIGYDFSGVDKPQKEGNLYGIRYAEFVVPMVKAMQEQQEIIEKQQKQIDELKATLETRSNSGAIKLGVNEGSDEILLGQNIPNPADNSTIIPFSIPANCKSASILITDHATGRTIKAVPLSCKDTHLMLDAGSLASGTYSYTLFVDGASVDTKQMVIVK
ncbi:MAG: tail fiber domain-containing protein, partial [Bacteroidota bacterium]